MTENALLTTGDELAILVYHKDQRKKAEAVVHRMVKRAIVAEGTVSVCRRPVIPCPLTCFGTDYLL